MRILLLLPFLCASTLQKRLEPGEKSVYYCMLNEGDVEATVQLNNYTGEEEVYYKIYNEKTGEAPNSHDFTPLVSTFSEKYTTPGVYRIELLNGGEDTASIGVFTTVMKADRINNDNLALKNLFLDIEGKLQDMLDSNMRLKTIQEKNIAEARKIRLGFRIMFLIPLAYVIIAFAKYKATQRMFNPKKGQKI
jgi:hypothetical protein